MNNLILIFVNCGIMSIIFIYAFFKNINEFFSIFFHNILRSRLNNRKTIISFFNCPRFKNILSHLFVKLIEKLRIRKFRLGKNFRNLRWSVLKNTTRISTYLISQEKWAIFWSSIMSFKQCLFIRKLLKGYDGLSRFSRCWVCNVCRMLDLTLNGKNMLINHNFNNFAILSHKPVLY